MVSVLVTGLSPWHCASNLDGRHRSLVFLFPENIPAVSHAYDLGVQQRFLCHSAYPGATGVIAYHPSACCTGWHASFQRNHPADQDRGNTGRVYDVFALISDLYDRDDPVI